MNNRQTVTLEEICLKVMMGLLEAKPKREIQLEEIWQDFVYVQLVKDSQ